MSEFKEKTENELKGKLGELKLSLKALRFGTSGSKARNVKEAHVMKKNIARILTEMNARIKKA